MPRTNDAQVRSDQYADLSNGMRIHYQSTGRRGDPLMLFMHGFPEAGFAWEEQLKAFGHTHHAVAPDLRGYNLSSKPAALERYKPKELVEDIRLLIEHFGDAPAVVVAHDWGGAVAWNVALRHPALVERLVILNSPHPLLFMRAMATDAKQQAASAYINRLRLPSAEADLSRDDFASLERSFFGKTPKAVPDWFTPAMRDRYHAVWSVPGEGGSHALTGSLNYYRANPAHPPSGSEAASAMADAVAKLDPADFRLDMPVRVIWGERDPFLTTALLDGLEGVCTDLRVTTVREGSHWLIHEMPQRINHLIEGALRE
ncbi:MAG: alpha/beta hydrolase [Rhizobacter sp.]|nr:alpha/beta hydrolase [Rhizobacter sp.]